MTDLELAEEIERAIREERNYLISIMTNEGKQIIAALRRGPVGVHDVAEFYRDEPERPPSGEMGYEEYHDGVIGVFKMNPDGSRNLKVLTLQASEQFRAMLSAAEASKEAK